MNTFDPKKRQVLTYDQFLKAGEKSENAKHIEKGEADLTKKAMSGERTGKKGIATLSEGLTELDDWSTEYDLFEREFSEKQRKTLADKGYAMPDGSFPIASLNDLKNAIKAHGLAKNISAAKKHIIKRAKALGKSELIPTEWKSLGKSELIPTEWK